MTSYNICVPVTYTIDGKEVVKQRRVGKMFENTRKETGEVYFKMRFDYPVAVTEMLGFRHDPNREADDPETAELVEGDEAET